MRKLLLCVPMITLLLAGCGGKTQGSEAEQLALLRAFAAGGQVIRCAYEMDEGSFLYLQEKLNRLRERKIG